SFVNKAILVPAAIAISSFIPWAITPLLMIGGAFLCYEGCEKLAHKFWPSAHDEVETHVVASNPKVDMVAFEKEKIKGAVRTDFILSAEIIVISLGTVAGVSLMQQISVLVTIAILMTIGVYGLVAGIVKLDDLGFYLRKKSSAVAKSIGDGILVFAPFLMKALSNLGMAAMFLVGGGILAHGIPAIAHFSHHYAEAGGIGGTLLPMLINLVVGFIAGAIVLAAVTGVKKLRTQSPRQ
ncbi:MAG: DUF808 domain-containing protein, partial [Proteobacteria bacterium]